MEILIRTKYKWLQCDLNEMEEPVNIVRVLKDPRLSSVLNFL